ncbi:MAG: hypothetical protein QF856_01080 [Candidatus Marinimicrobia bacterium]|jgi:hypothetical protein|nr:hypothetical protein [Candidatus Neomarinimicrobiota bacterium]
MLKRNKMNLRQLYLQSFRKLSIIIKIIFPLGFSLLCISGCYTIPTPPPDYKYQEENLSTHEQVDSSIVANQYINNYYCSRCSMHENSCGSINWRYNSWTDSYYCDPYYYNYSYYSHHKYCYYWQNSYHDWNHHDYSHNYSYRPAKKTKRNRSFSRLSYDTVVENSSQDNTNSSPSQSDSYNSQDNKSYNQSTENSATSTDSQTNKSTAKPRRKHNRKPL